MSSDKSPAGPLADRWPTWADGRTRRALAATKLLLYKEDHLGLVLQHISHRLGDHELISYVSKFASRSPNLFKAVVDAVAVAYSRGCQRELRGATEPVQRAFADIVAESGIDRLGNGINARAWALGPTILSPHLDVRNRLRMDVITPDACDVRLSGGYLEALLWRIGSTWIELDAEAWRYYTARGELERVVEHSAGVCPAAVFSASDNSTDWWSSTDHQGLVDASLDVGYKMALGLYYRQVSGNKLLVVKGNLEDIPPGQSLGHPALPLFLRGSPSETDVSLLDRNIPASDHLEEIAAIIALAVSVYGIPPGEISTGTSAQSGWGGLTIAVRGERLGALRDKQVPFLRASELELWPLACDLIRGSSHRHARILPPGDEAREMLRVSFPDLASAEDILHRIEAMKAGLPYGISSPADFMLASRPELTRSDVNELRASNLAEYLDSIEPLVSRNIPAEAPAADGAQTIAQQQGAVGGQKSGQIRNEESK